VIFRNLILQHLQPYAKKQTWAELEKSRTRVMLKIYVCAYIFLFALKARLQVLKFEFYQIKLGLEQRINLKLTGKISLKFDSQV